MKKVIYLYRQTNISHTQNFYLMKNRNTMLAAFFTLACFLPLATVNAQTTETAPAASSFKVTADLVSSYVWRGVLSSATPNFQPTFSVVKGGLEIGAWGSTSFDGKYKEMDLFASYSAGPLKFTLTDYNWTFGQKYFNYKSKETDHVFEGSIGYTGPESFPLTVSANLMFAGADKKWDSDLGAQDPSKQAYSTYIEFGYAFKNFTPFLGVTPSDGYYGDYYGGYSGFSVCNLGLSATKSLKITDSFSLPLKATLGFNPQQEDAYLVFGITF
jgi:hypothetical protein